MKRFRFFFHYNKPASAQAKEARISIHYRGKCHIVKNVFCLEPIAGRTSQKSPKFVVTGTCYPDSFSIENDVAYIGFGPGV